MGKERKHTRPDLSDFFDYTEGKMSDKERNAFERKLQKDPFEADAAEGLAGVTRKEAMNDLGNVASRIRRRKQKRRRITWYSAAAAVAAMAIVATIFFNTDQTGNKEFSRSPELRESPVRQSPVEERTEGEEPKAAKKAYAPVKDKSDQSEKPVSSPDQESEESSLAYQANEYESSPDLAEEKSGSNVMVGEGATTANDLKKEPRKDEIPEISEILAIEEDALELEEFEIASEADEVREFDMVLMDEEEYADPVQPVLREQKGEINLPENRIEPTEMAHKRSRLPEPASGNVTTGEAAGVSIPETGGPQVAGIIRSAEDLQPLPGVSVFLKGTDEGTVTDIAGYFSLPTSKEYGTTVIASFVGMETEEFSLDTTQNLEIAMVPDNMSLDEVVVIRSDEDTLHDQYGAELKDITPGELTIPVYQSATPVDGIAAYKDYIDSALVYPHANLPYEKEVVVLKFYIGRYGRPHTFSIIRSPSESYSEEAIRVIKDGPDWEPASRDGEYVDDPVRLRVVFRPE